MLQRTASPAANTAQEMPPNAGDIEQRFANLWSNRTGLALVQSIQQIEDVFRIAHLALPQRPSAAVP
jgi:hypothetical protein